VRARLPVSAHSARETLVWVTTALDFVTTSPRNFLALGNLRACCLSLDVVAVSQAPSPESNSDSPLPVKASRSHVPSNQQLIRQSLESGGVSEPVKERRSLVSGRRGAAPRERDHRPRRPLV
jgi:hypothetical protein